MPGPSHATRLSIRLAFDKGAMFGPGRAELLALIAETGSIAAAGRRLGMSYKRAWGLVEAMNANAAMPLVASSRGGAKRGGASLTATGDRVLALYREMEAKARAASAAELRDLETLLKGTARPSGK